MKFLFIPSSTLRFGGACVLRDGSGIDQDSAEKQDECIEIVHRDHFSVPKFGAGYILH